MSIGGCEITRIILVADAVQDRDQHDRDRLVEVQQPCGLGEDLAGVAGVGVEVPGGALRAAGQQRPGVRQHDGIVVDVHDPGFGRYRLGDLMRVVR
jgi:hypothetical protein